MYLRVNMNHRMYWAALLAIMFNMIFKHMTKLVAPSLKVLQEGMKERNCSQYDSFILTGDMKVVLINTQTH